MITERRTKASDTPFLVARNTFRVFVKAGDVFDVGVGDIIVSSDAFCQNLAANTETNKRKLDDGKLDDGRQDDGGSTHR